MECQGPGMDENLLPIDAICSYAGEYCNWGRLREWWVRIRIKNPYWVIFPNATEGGKAAER